MNLFYWLLGITPEPKKVHLEPSGDSRYHGFTVEHFPLNQYYVATYRGKYLKKEYETSTIVWCALERADKFTSERAAWDLVDKAIEQETKDNVVIITR